MTTTSILLRPPPASPAPSPSPSPSPSPISTPLPALQTDLSSSSSSTSGSYLDLHRASSSRSTRRIRFAPLPEPNRDLLLDPHDTSCDDPQSDTKSATKPVPPPDDPHGGALALSPSVSPDSTLSSARSTPTIRLSPYAPSKHSQKSSLKLLRPFSFLRRADPSPSSPSPLTHSASLPSSRNTSLSSLPPSSCSVPNSPSSQSVKLLRISDDFLSLGRISFFRPRSASSSSARPPRTSSPPPKRSDPSKSLHRSASTGSGPPVNPVNGKRDREQGSTQSHGAAAVAGSGPRRRRASSSALTFGAGGGRHTSSVNMLPNDSVGRSTTAPSSPLARPRKHVKMLNGRVYGAKRYAAQTLANPFANVRDEPEFVEWGYGGMGSVQASAGIASDMWKGLQRSERGGALLAGSSFGSSPTSAHPSTGVVTVGGGRGSGARATSPVARRRMSDNIPECGMGNVGVGDGFGEDDGSGMAWVKKRRAEKEEKARVEQEAKELERKTQEKRRSGDSTMNASMYASTASTTTSLTACTSVTSTDLTTPTTSPLASRSPSMADLKLTSSPSSVPRDLDAAPPCAVTAEHFSTSGTAIHPLAASKDEHEHHVLTAVRLSPNLSSASHKHEQAPQSPVDTETGTNSSGEEPSRASDEEEEEDNVDDDDGFEVQDVRRKTALGAGVEKISRHVDVETR